MFRPFLALAAMASVVIAAPAPLYAQQAADTPVLNRSDVETIVREYLVANPEVLEEAFMALQTKRQATADAERAEALASVRDDLESSTNSAVLGNPDGDVTLVEFFDYNCGFCRRALSDLDELIEGDPNLRVVLKELPVLGEGSVRAAAVSIAVHNIAPEAYPEFHKKLLSSEGRADDQVAFAVVDEMGLPRDEIEVAMRSDKVRDTVSESNRLARLLQIEGTPSYVIGDVVEQGAVGVDQLRARINQQRCGEDVC
ncbi:DsbA family protein [Acuticoccus sediminis]|nr:DsbA family protein [Acuticoccus sediminis]